MLIFFHLIIWSATGAFILSMLFILTARAGESLRGFLPVFWLYLFVWWVLLSSSLSFCLPTLVN